MANFTSNLDLVQQAQSSKEITINGLANSASQAMFMARRESTSSGLSWGYYGGNLILPTTGALSQIANGTISLTASTTNYIQMSASGAITTNTTGFLATHTPLYQVTCGTVAPTTWIDYRTLLDINCPTVTVNTTASLTVTSDAARAKVILVTGTLTSQINLTLPIVQRQYFIVNNTTGGFGVQAIQASGTGVVIANGKAAQVLTGQTNVIRLTLDA